MKARHPRRQTTASPRAPDHDLNEVPGNPDRLKVDAPRSTPYDQKRHGFESACRRGSGMVFQKHFLNAPAVNVGHLGVR